MNIESLLASAGINLGLAVVILSLFSILKKHPSNAYVYYARPLSIHTPLYSLNGFFANNNDKNENVSGFKRWVPSVSWVRRCVNVSEDEVLELAGLDALILIRLFKFSIKFFVVCSIVGLVILIPVNFGAYGGPTKSSHSMDAFTISNIEAGSNKLWVHFSCLWFISCYGLYLLHKEYKDISTKRIQQLRKCRHKPEQFTVLVRQIPLCDDHKAYSCCVDHFFSKHYSYDYQTYQVLYNRKELDKLSNEAKCLARKIEVSKGSLNMTRGRGREYLLSDAAYPNEKVLRYRKRLEEIQQSIRLLQCQKALKEKEVRVAFVTFKTRKGAALASQSQQHSNPLLWITEMAPEPRDVLWKNLEIPFRRLPLYKIGAYSAATLLTIFFAIPVTAVQGIAKFEKLKKWFPPAMAVQLIPGLGPVVTGYLPSAVLNGFIYLIPFTMYGMARLAGYVSRSKNEIRACNMFFYFLLGNVFFLSLLSGSLLDQIGESFFHPRDIPSRLASAVSAQADFFITYILTNGLAGFSLEILQPGLLLFDKMISVTWRRGKEKTPYIYSLPYCRFIPLVAISFLIGMVYATVAPLLLPFVVFYFLLGYIVFVNQIKDVYEIVYETNGQYWPFIHHYIFLAIVLSQVTMIGLFGLKSKPSASFATIPLLVLTILFNEYCKNRFLPTFLSYPVQDAASNDELDEESDIMMEADGRSQPIEAYRPPSLRSTLEFAAAEESTSSDPLIC